MDAADVSRLLNPLILVLALLSYLRKNEAIGGWLMFFFCQAYLGVLVALLISIPAVSALYPPSYSHSSSVAGVAVLLAMLRLTGYGSTAVVATFLLQTHEWLWVQRLRFAIGANLMLNGACLVLDQIYFPEALMPNVVRWLVMCGWLVYFLVSARVRMVFHTKDWGKIPVQQFLQ